MNIKNLFNFFVLTFSIGLLISCGGDTKSNDNGTETVTSKRAGKEDVIVHLTSDVDKLNPITSTSSNATQVHRFLFQNLLSYEIKTQKKIPILAKSRPEIVEEEMDFFGKKINGVAIHYEIREEAKWNDGTPIIAEDVLFSLKCYKNPKVDCEHARSYFKTFFDAKIDPKNPKKFTLYAGGYDMNLEMLSADIPAMPRHIYDPNNTMAKYSIKDFSNPKNKQALSDDLENIKFGEYFNSEKLAREKGFVEGSGPYVFESWKTGERIILLRNENWWAKDLVGKESGFYNIPSKFTYEVIVDNTTSKTAQQDESLDVMKHTPKDYVKLVDDKNFTSKFGFSTPTQLSYSYISFHMKNPKLADKKLRQAMSMTLDYDKIIKVFYYGLAERIVGPIHPTKPFYNKDLELYPYDLKRAAALLDEAGWKDTNGDGIREKMIDGVNTDLQIELLIPSGGEIGPNIGLMMQTNFAKIGGKLEIVTKEWTVFIEETKAHNFEMAMSGWVSGLILPDMTQIWHTNGYNGGSNYTGFGNAETDKIVENIKVERDEAKRAEMYMRMQEITHDEAPYIFMFTTKAKLALHKRFSNAEGIVRRPNYNESTFVLDADFGVGSKNAPVE